MLLVIIAVALIALLAVWPTMGCARELLEAAPEDADELTALDRRIARRRRSKLWWSPLAFGAAIDLQSLLVAGDEHWAVQIGVGMAVAFALIVPLGIATVIMWFMSRRKVRPAERDAYFERCREARAKTGLGRVIAGMGKREAGRPAGLGGSTAATERVLSDPAMDALGRHAAKLAASAHEDERRIAQRSRALLADILELEDPVLAQTYAEQVLGALDAYAQIQRPTAEDAADVLGVIDIADKVIRRENDRADDKARASLDVMRRSTEMLYERRYGTQPGNKDNAKS